VPNITRALFVHLRITAPAGSILNVRARFRRARHIVGPLLPHVIAGASQALPDRGHGGGPANIWGHSGLGKTWGDPFRLHLLLLGRYRRARDQGRALGTTAFRRVSSARRSRSSRTLSPLIVERSACAMIQAAPANTAAAGPDHRLPRGTRELS